MGIPNVGGVALNILGVLNAAAGGAFSSVPTPAGTPSANPGAPMPQLDPAAMAAAQFGPQYAALSAARNNANANYTQAGKDAQSMYGALSNQILGQETGIKKNYADSGQAIGSAYNNAINASNQAFDSGEQQVSDIAQRLGLGAALPQVTSNSNTEQARLAGLMDAQNASFRGVNTLLGNNDVAYNRETGNTAKLAGNNVATDLHKQLLQALQGYDQQGMQLQGQQKSAENNYAMAIQKMVQDSQQAQATLAERANASAQTAAIAQANAMLGQGRLGLDTAKFNADQSKVSSTAAVTPYEKLAQTAAQFYPNNYAAANAEKAITDTLTRGFNGDNQFANATEFINAMLGRNPKSTDRNYLSQMALDFYTQLAGGANKPLNQP